MGCYDIDRGDFSGYTPLAWVVHNAHEDVVKILLGWEEIDPDNGGKTPLSHATWSGYEGVLKIPLKRQEANPTKPDNQCSQSSSPSVFGVGRDGLRLIVRLFWRARTDYAREG